MKRRQTDNDEIGLPTSSLAGLGSKNVFDGLSRKSTAMSNLTGSEIGTPGDMKRLGSGQTARKDSVTKLKNSNTERGNVLL